MSRIAAIDVKTHPYDRDHDVYQTFYRSALRAACTNEGIAYSETSGAYADGMLRGLRRIKSSYKLRNLLRGVPYQKLTDALARILSKAPLYATEPVSHFDAVLEDGKRFKCVIDTHDSRHTSPLALASCDLYFKTNYWPTDIYPSKVVPLQNLNPMVDNDREFFRSCRTAPKIVDLLAFFRIWGGDDELAGIDHNLALIESFAKVPCSKFVCAYLVAGNTQAMRERLEPQGIQCIEAPIPPSELWKQMAAAKLNVVRLGMHECIPWRMTDVLAMGGCPVIDYGPRTVWPEPLVEGAHYLNLNVPPGSNSAHVPELVMSWLREADLVTGISRNTAAYFDQYLEPLPLGRSLLAAVNAALQVYRHEAALA